MRIDAMTAAQLQLLVVAEPIPCDGVVLGAGHAPEQMEGIRHALLALGD